MFDRVEAYHRPGSIPEALRLFQTGNGGARFLAGGTDLINQADRSIRSLIDVTQLGLSYIRRADDGWAIGATTTLVEVEASPITRAIAGGILQKAASLSGPIQVRNMATVGGRLATNSTYSEIQTVLLALDAQTRREESLILEIAIPGLPSGAHVGWSFQKLGRTASDISQVNVAAGLQLDRRGKCEWVRIAVGGAGHSPIRAAAAEELLLGGTMDAHAINGAAAGAASAVQPKSGVRGPAEYLREMGRVLTRRALLECAREGGRAL